MLHQPWSSVEAGTAQDFRERADLLDKVAGQIVGLYAGKTRRPAAEIRALLAAGQTWFTAAEALKFGLIDAIGPALKVAANLTPAQKSSLENRMSEILSPEAIELHCRRAGETALFSVLAGQTFTEPELQARLADAVEVRNICKIARTPELANNLVLAGTSPADAKRLTWDYLVARDERTVIDGTPPDRPRVSNPVAFGGYGYHHVHGAMIDALAQRQGARLTDPHPAAADLANCSLLDLAGMALQSAGRPTHMRSPDHIIRAAMTTSDFPLLLAAGAERALQELFEDLTREHRALCSLRSLKNFKEATVVNVSQFPGLELKPEAQEINYGSLSERGERIKLATYARGLALTREAIINDDLGGLAAAMKIAANAAARLERDLVFGLIVANPTMSDGQRLFSAAHGNIEAHAHGLSIAGLNKARAKMRLQKDSSGGYILTRPRYLLCPVGQEADAEALVASLTYRPEATVERETPRWLRGLEIISDPRLDDLQATDWYLLSAPSTAPTIELATLNNRNSPTIEVESDFDRDIQKMKCRYDVGVAAMGWAGAVRTSHEEEVGE